MALDYGVPIAVAGEPVTSRTYACRIIAAVDASKPSARVAGDECFALDTGKLYGSKDGSTWTQIGGGSASEAFAVGSIFIAVVSTNPATLLGYGTWTAFGAGRVIVGLDAGNPAFDTVKETGGVETVTLAESQIPAHTHVQNSHNHTQDAHSHNIGQVRDATTGGATTNVAKTVDTSSTLGTSTPTDAVTPTNQAATAVNQNTGGGLAHTNLQPYIVAYLWERTA